MANVFASNPIRVDTVMTGSYKAAVAASLGTLFTLIVQQVRWLDVGTVGDELLIVDPQDGAELLHLRATAVAQPPAVAGTLSSQEFIADWSGFPRKWRDFQVVQLSSGRVDIFTV